MKQHPILRLFEHWRLGVTLMAVILLGGVSWAQHEAVRLRAGAAPAAGPAIVSIVRASGWPVSDAEVETLVRQAVSEAMPEGLTHIIRPGDTVVIKPNLFWGATVDEGYTTDPRVVRAVVRLAQEAGAGKVVIADGAAHYRDGHDARGATAEAFRACGYDADGNMVDDATGAQLIDLNDAGGLDQHDPNLVKQVNIPNGLIWNVYWLPRVVLEANVVIGVPVLKNHSLAGVTLALKNQFGIAPSDIYHNRDSNVFKGALGHGPNDLSRHIVDLNLARPLDFVLVDGLRGMTNGPDGGALANPRMRLIVAGADPVAVDTIGALIMGYDAATIPHLSLAAGAGLGNSNVSQITVRGLRVSQARRDFPAPYGDPPAQRAESTQPTIRITWPVSGSVITEQTTISASASDDRTIAKVEFYADDELEAVVAQPPYQAHLDLSGRVGRAVSLRAVAYDRALNDAEAKVSVAVVRAPDPGTVSFQTTTLPIPTYPYTPYLQLRSSGVYSYHWLDWDDYTGGPPVSQDYTLLVMENDYLQVTLLPELGGRVYQLIDKATGDNELYQNPVIKPTNWGPPEQGWWLAVGGIEWCLPVDEHGYEWGEPWSWSAVTSTAGVTVTVRDTQATDRLRAAIDLFLPTDRAYLAVTPRLENPTTTDVSYKFWMNAMLAPGATNTVGADLRFIFNADQVTIHSSGDAGSRVPNPGEAMPWPVYNGRDFSRLGNWRQWLGFFERPQAAADFVGVYDVAANEGMARVFPSNVARGTKGFGMGWSEPIAWSQWTDDGSTYVEMHGGVAPTFWDAATLPAGAALAWSEYWYPVGGIGVFSTATAEAALSVNQDGANLRIGAHSTAARESTLYTWDRATCAQLARWDFSIDPAHPFSATVVSGGRAQNQVSVAYVDSQGRLLATINPANCLAAEARVEPLPPWVETTFSVTWAKPGDGVAAYQVQVRDGYEGSWTNWLTSTNVISATFTGAHGHTYFFRARTLTANPAAWGDEEWGQAFTTVLLEPAPVLVTSRKTAAWNTMPTPVGSTVFLPGEMISYSLLISNTGNLSATVVVTDPALAGMIVLPETFAADYGAPPIYTGDAIQWSGAVMAGETIWLRYGLAPTPAIRRGEPITNMAEIAGSVLGPFTRQAAVAWGWTCYLPIVLR